MLAARLRQVRRELGFLLLCMPIAIVAFAVLLTAFSAGVGTVIVYIGVPLLLASLFAARGFGTLERVRLGWAGRDVSGPEWDRAPRTPGFRGMLKSVLGNGDYWLHLLHGTVVNPIVGTFTWVMTITWTALALGGTTYWVWSRFLPQDGDNLYLSQIVADFVQPGTSRSMDPVLADNLMYLVLGIVFLATLPAITKALVTAHHGIARTMLGGGR